MTATEQQIARCNQTQRDMQHRSEEAKRVVSKCEDGERKLKAQIHAHDGDMTAKIRSSEESVRRLQKEIADLEAHVSRLYHDEHEFDAVIEALQQGDRIGTADVDDPHLSAKLLDLDHLVRAADDHAKNHETPTRSGRASRQTRRGTRHAEEKAASGRNVDRLKHDVERAELTNQELRADRAEPEALRRRAHAIALDLEREYDRHADAARPGRSTTPARDCGSSRWRRSGPRSANASRGGASRTAP